MRRPRYLAWMHGIGAVLSVVALFLGGLRSPAIGFPIAVAILIALEVLPAGVLAHKSALRGAYGSIKRGGIRRGIFIKELFTFAVIYLAIGSFTHGMKAAGLSNVVLGVALIISSIASEIEASMMKRAIRIAREHYRDHRLDLGSP